MPQLDSSTYSSQLFWLVVCFVVLYFILSYIALPKIAKVLEAREETIEDKINKASMYREQAENLLADYEAILAQAREDAHLHLKTTSTTVSAELMRKQKEVLDKLNDRLHLAEQELYRSRIEAGYEISKMSEDLSEIILTKLTGKGKEA
jgi:F-type H+-transporting ATPase subunit b